jgi:PAS domain S-box-containing protein
MNIFRPVKKESILQILLFIVIGIVGALYIRYTWIRFENEKSDQIMQIARSIEATLPKDDLKELEAKPEDILKPQYQKIKNILKDIVQINETVRFAYIYTEQKGKLFFIADSEIENSKDYSPPGQEYYEANIVYKQPFKDGKELTTGSVTDRWGTWISILIPIKEETSGKTIAVYGMDINAKAWDGFIFFEVSESSIVLLLLLLIAFFLVKIRFKNQLLKQDIAKRKKAENALRESEDKYSKAFQTAPYAISITSVNDGRFIDINNAFTTISGYSKEDVLSDSTIGLNLWVNLDDRVRVVTKLLNGENIFSEEYQFNTKKGNVIFGLFSAQIIFLNNESFVLSSINDITERKIIEESLKQSEEKYRQLIENSHDIIYMLLPDGTFTFVSPAWTRLLGHPIDQVFGHSFQEFVHPDDIPGCLAWLKNGLESDQRQKGVEYRVKHLDGSWRWHISSAMPFKDKNGIIVRFEGTARDITDRKIAEEEIKLKNKELLLINSEKDKFFSIIAHDLRSPFNAFIGLTQIMAEELSTLSMNEIQVYAESMKNSASNLYRLLENLLNWSKIQQGLIPFNAEILRLLPIVEESMLMLLEAAKNKNIEISLNIPNDIKVSADENMLNAIIRNLVSNAIKFTPKGGKINLSASENGENYVEITIKDTGIGMTDDMIENLFKLDVNTNRPGTDGEASTGLGLILCKEFIEKHKGKLWVKCNGDKGCTFWFTIPSINK